MRIQAGMCALALLGTAQAAELSEQDYFNELPTVLTVSRLAQPLSETPGAVTIIDRETIRRSGARELADVLRLVPGFLVGGWNGANPTAAYHAPIDTTGSRNLVMIDGRPVYSAYYVGDTHHGMMGVLLEDIERIEVLRGSNTAAYGANAMFGVINVITRNAADTSGVELSVSGGNGGINDNMARIGWGNETAKFRLSTGRRADNGYLNAYDNKIVSQLHFRGDMRLSADQELMISAGSTQLSAGDGFPPVKGDYGNPERTTSWNDIYFHGVWQRQLSATDQIKITANYDEEAFGDAYFYGNWGITVSTNGHGRRTNLELQHQIGISNELRAVWGAGYKYEEAISPALYSVSNSVSLHEERLFGNLEWRPNSLWTINAGGFWGNHSWKGDYFSPRFMVNFHAMPDHTLRMGVTESYRMPTLFELASDVRYLSPLYTPYVYRLYGSDGKVGPEKLYAKEVGYFGNFRDWRLTLDVRGFVEHMQDAITRKENPYSLAQILLLGKNRFGYINDSGSFDTRGVEYQLRWKPFGETEIMVNQTFQTLIWNQGQDDAQPPSHSTTLALFQKLPHDLDLTLMYYSLGAMTWGNAKDSLPSSHRIDARVALPFRIGSTKAEAAVVVQSVNGGNPEYQFSKNFVSERRAFGTLRLEF